MKKILIILLLIISILITGCYNIISTKTVATTTINELADKDREIERLNGQLEDLTAHLSMSEEENKKYDYLIRNLNNLLKNVYYVYGENSGGPIIATGFSIYYKNNYYLLSAGHCVENEYGKFGNFKFKANFSDKWIYPKLLAYENIYGIGKDYAIFYYDKIDNGFLTFNDNQDSKKYVLGSINNNLNVFKEYSLLTSIAGESGSPVINIDQEIIGIFTGSITYINTITEAIDNLK